MIRNITRILQAQCVSIILSLFWDYVATCQFDHEVHEVYRLQYSL